MADDQAAPEVKPTPSAMRAGGNDPIMSLVSKKVGKLRAGQGDAFADLVNSKVSKLREGQPAPEPKYTGPVGGEIKPWTPNWHERLFGGGGFSGAVKEAKDAASSGDLTEGLKSFLNHPLAAVDELLFPGNQRTTTGQVMKGAAGSVTGLTSPTMLGMTAGSYAAGIGEAKTIAGGLHALGTAMMPTMGVGMVENAQRIKQARDEGDDEAEHAAWGDLVGNIAMIAVPHAGGKVMERVGLRELNEHARSEHGKDFRQLSDQEKMQVAYKAAEDANPKLRKRIDQEVAKVNAKKVPGKGGQTVGEEREAFHKEMVEKADPNGTPILTYSQQVRQEAAQKVISQILRQQAAEEQHRQARAEAEAKIHADREQANKQAAAESAEAQRKAASAIEDEKKRMAEAESPSIAEQRGFLVNDYRVGARGERGLIKTTYREKYEVHGPGGEPEPPIRITDTRAGGGELPDRQRASELERPIQEYAEREHGASFSKLPLDQQRIVASHFERVEPEKWDAFKATSAYGAFRRHADLVDAATPAIKRYLDRDEGSGELLADGADVHTGVARLLLDRTDVPATLKADPDTYRGVNEHAEKVFGKSFDTLDEGQKPAALGGYLRENPDKLESFTSPDVAERMRKGQHVDLANMEANLRDKQQVQSLMQYRDLTRAAMDEQFAGEITRQVRAEHINSVQDLIRRAPAGETTTSDTISAQAKGVTQLAERIALDDVADKGDLFQVEAAIRKVPEADRSADMRQYLSQVRQLRATAENELIRQYREGLIAQMREDAQGARGEGPRGGAFSQVRAEVLEAREAAAREIAKLEDQRHTALRLADAKSGENATPEQQVQAQALQDTAAFIQRKEDAAVSAVHIVEGARAQPAGDSIPMVSGRSTYIELNSGEKIPAHYAVVEMADLIASHDPLENFRPDPRFPAEAQPRDYQAEKELQAGVYEKGNNPNGDVYHSDSIHPTDGPPIIRKDGVVVSGNGREQGAEVAASLGNWEPVRVDLLERAQRFGVNPEEIAKHKAPILVRVMDAMVTDPADLARYGIEMNRDASMGMSAAEQAAALSRMLTPRVVDRMAEIFGSLSGDATLRTAMRARSAELAQVLQDAGLVDPKKRAAYFDEDGDLTETAKGLIENALLGTTVTDQGVVRRAPDDVKVKLGRVSKDFVVMRAAGENWNLASYNTDAIELYTRARDQALALRNMEGKDVQGSGATGGESLIERMLHPDHYRLSNYGFSFDGQALHPPVHPVVEALAMALEETPREYSKMIGDYADSASGKVVDMFGGGATPWDSFNKYIGGKYGIEAIPEEWGTVEGLPEPVKKQIEAARGPMEVEPARHEETVREAVQPDASSVDEALKGTTPRSVSEFRDALASHPGFTEEQAQALAETFEQILPQAIGESFADILGNRRLALRLGGGEPGRRGYTEFIDEANTAIHLFAKADPSTVVHEMFHFLRRYMKPEHQAAFNEFVGAKPGAEWTVEQEEKAAQAFERYHFDGGRRRGALEKAFAVIHKAMQSVYDAVTGRGLVDPSPRIRQMFDQWYDWERTERKPITARNDVAKLVEAVKDPKVTIPKGAKVLDETASIEKGAQNFVFTSREQADDFIEKNSRTIRTYQLLDGKDGQHYVRASFQPGTKRLYQGNMSSIGDLARQAKALEDELKRTTDPRIEARLRAQLNGIENKLGVSTYVFGSKPEVRDNEVTQLIHGLGEMPTVQTPTTPAQAVQVRQVMGDPTDIEVRANGGKTDVRALPDEAPGLPKSDGTAEIPRGAGEADGRDKAAGQPLRGRKRASGGAGEDISTPAVNPLAKVPAASLKAPARQRGTPVVDPEAWRGHVEALGLPEGTPPPTVRIPDDLRNMMLYPGQSEAVEVALSGLQQHDAVMVAAPTGSGKCLAPGTPLVMYDGTVKIVEDVRVGDLLMGPDSTPRKVLSLASGTDEMYRVTPNKGDPYTVNAPHILSLKYTILANDKRSGTVINIAVSDYVARSRGFKSVTKGYRAAVDFAEQETPVDPYLLGLWLGDGTSCRLQITNQDPEVVDFVRKFAEIEGVPIRDNPAPGGCPQMSLTHGPRKKSRIWSEVVRMGLKNNKHIPHAYIANSKESRLRILAGIIDSDGCLEEGVYAVILKNERLAKDLLFLARSLGFAASFRRIKHAKEYGVSEGIYFRVRISGDLDRVPVLIPRKKASPRKQKKDVLVTGIKVEPVGPGEYYGFELDGDHLFLLGDFTVTHNTFMGLAIADQLLGNDSNKVGLVVTISQNLIHEADGYVSTGQRLGVQVEGLPKDINDVQGGGVYAATYTGIRGNSELLSVPWDFVIFDEAAAGRKWTESEQGKAVVLLGHASKKVVYMSATPWHTALEVGYAHKLGMWPEGGFFEWGRQFGLVEVGPNSYSGGYAPKKMMKLRQQLIERGQWVSLHRDMDGVSGHVALVEQTQEVKDGIKGIRDGFAFAAKVFKQRGMSTMAASLKGNEVTYLKRFIEASRLPEVLAKAKEAIAGGWQPVIFSEYRSGSKQEVDGKIDDMFSKLPPGTGDYARSLLPKLPNLVEAVRKELGEDAAIFAGDANQLREEERTQFNKGKKRGLFTTYAAGGTGVSFHDRVGDKPRMGLFLGLPWSGIMFEQSQGRTWRYGTKSNVANIFFTSDTLPEMKVLATKILPRMRALNASVYGEDMESRLSKNLRDSTGITEDMIDYEMGNEATAEASHFEQSVKGTGYTPADQLKLPKAKDAMNKGMKYKAQPKRLYQDEPQSPAHRDAEDAYQSVPLDSLPPSLRRAISANAMRIQASAVEAASQAVPGVEAPAQAVRRVTNDNFLNAKLMHAAYDTKKNSRATGNFVKEFIRLFNTSGDRAVWKYFADSGMEKEGKEIQRKLIERQHLITEHRGEMMDKVADFTDGLTPKEHALAVQVLEGKTASNDPRINKAADGYRKLFADVRKQLGDAGATFKSPDQSGRMVEVPWKDFHENPTYWPHIWNWNEKITLRDAQGKLIITTLGDLHDMDPGEERDKLIESYAAKRGIDRVKAHEFFSKNRRSVKLAPNLERTRDSTMGGYDTSMRAVGIYINQASEMLANIATVGQEREKINPAIHSLPTHAMRMVDSIVTADLNPLSIGGDNSRALRVASQWVVLSKMGMSVLKLPTHVMLKTPLVTNTRSMIAGMLEFARHPQEITRMSREAGILTDYVRQAMMMEYGLHDGEGFDRKMLKYTGFTSSIWLSRVVAGAAGRHFLTVHAEPALRKNPADMILRRKLSDLYGYSEADLDRIATEGINEHDVKRSMIASADWTTGSGRASELPPVLRATGDDHPIMNNLRTLIRLAYLLKTYTFKTASLVNRTVFDEVGKKNFKPVMRLLVNGGASGLALNLLQMGMQSVTNPAAAEEEKRRFAAIKDHPQAIVWLEGANLSYALGLYPLKVLFDRLGTYDQGDIAKSNQQKRLENAFSEELGGILGSDLDHLKNSVIEYGETFQDDGVNHRDTPGERRSKILNKLATEEISPLKMAEGLVHHAGGGEDQSGASSGYIPHRRVKHATHHRR